MLASAVCAMLQGARGYVAIAEWIHMQEVELWHAFGFTRRPPTAGAFRKLLMTLSPTHFEQVLADWAKYCLGVSTDQSLEAVAMDGKTLCGTLQPHERAVHLLALLDQRTGCVLSQSRVDAKTNEHKAALELLKTLVLEGRVITGDAMFCQREVCQAIRNRGGHYFFVVKDNQPELKAAIAAEFKAAFSPYQRTAARVAPGRGRNGRQEERSAGASTPAIQYAIGRSQRLA
jgi:predicted transposase YbfD/YdcC